ncbi:hypothetical protein GCM10023084_82190 [Streptomyces lacrimifluminis]|uniref:Secreted protein n=1 Tax=Streptomyces lacrimifluminis TaxID=1500077 RepID=A0A917PDJ1_9ACTN|nr:hypothetical protein GCM10012282_80980 [Streptomyces lacrimifluminis]
MTRKMGRALAVTTAVVGLSALAIGPAFAVPVSSYQGDDFARLSYAGLGGHTTDIVEVCDREADGHGVYVKVWKRDGYEEFGDANGSASPCSSRSYRANWITSIQVCETHTGPDACGRREVA